MADDRGGIPLPVPAPVGCRAPVRLTKDSEARPAKVALDVVVSGGHALGCRVGRTGRVVVVEEEPEAAEDEAVEGETENSEA